MNHRKTVAWFLILLGLIAPLVACGYLLVKYPMALKGYFIPLFPQIVLEIQGILLAGTICFLLGISLWIVDFAVRRAKSGSVAD